MLLKYQKQVIFEEKFLLSFNYQIFVIRKIFANVFDNYTEK